MQVLSITTTVGTEQDAVSLANAILEQRLAACMQCEPVTSHYRWGGKVVHEGEVRLVCKTTPAARDPLLAFIQARHPYAVPEILMHAVEVSDAYGSWVESEVQHGAS